jgi:hypothetical protein
MVISSEHHDLLEQFKAANEEQGAAIDALLAYLNVPNHDMKVAVKLSQQMEEASNKVAKIYNQLEAVRLDR